MKPALFAVRNLLCALVALLPATSMVFAENERQNSVLLFGGLLMQGDFGSSFIPFRSGFDNRAIFGAALQRNITRWGNGVGLGVEAGLAGRLGPEFSGEAWAGVSVSHSGFSFNGLTISPALVVGLSAVNTAVGIERSNGDARLLFYLGPELQFRSATQPNMALVYRIHHRSGAWGTLGNMREGSNSNVIGLRIDY